MAIQREFTYLSSDSTHRVHAQWWLPEPPAQPKAVVQLVHGISEYIGRYAPFARFLTENGWAVVGHDHLGHGHTASSPAEYGWFGEHQAWRYVLRDTRALRLLAGKEYPGIPYFLMGHSMGSFVVRGYLMAYPGTVDGAILSGTGQESAPTVAAGRLLSALACKNHGTRSHSKLLDNLSVGRYNHQFAPNRTSADWISRDEAVVDAYLADPLCQFLPTAGMYHDMMCALQYLVQPENLRRLHPDTPIYLFSGDQDPVGASGAGVKKVAALFRRAGVQDITLKLYPGGRHEMLNEINREEVFQDTLAWLETHLAKIQVPAGAGR
jgi:alpha-beta hydrolase superfamily lysophospholipase